MPEEMTPERALKLIDGMYAASYELKHRGDHYYWTLPAVLDPGQREIAGSRAGTLLEAAAVAPKVASNRPLRFTDHGPTMVRFGDAGTLRHDDGHEDLAYIVFIRAVNKHKPGTFGTPELLNDKPFPGHHTERYPTARVVFAPDSGIRIVADTVQAAEAFRLAARDMGVHIS
jgi:hypothetical protein